MDLLCLHKKASVGDCMIYAGLQLQWKTTTLLADVVVCYLVCFYLAGFPASSVAVTD